MEFFNYRMPPFLTVMGALYILVAAPVLINLLRDGYWSGVARQISRNLIRYKLHIAIFLLLDLVIITWLDIPVTLAVKQMDTWSHSYTFWDFICSCAEGGLLSGVLFTGLMLADYFKIKKLALTFKISLMGSIYAGLANGILKFLFNRQRPSIGLDQWHFFAFFESGAKHFDDLMYAFNSMPSGHTISTVSALVPFFMAYRNKYVRSFLVLWAILVSFSRVYTINHWLSDVLMSCMLGIIIGLAVYQANCKRYCNEN